jgi:hypothetical protein
MCFIPPLLLDVNTWGMKLREVIDKITESASVMICYRHFFLTWTTAGLRQPEQYIILPKRGNQRSVTTVLEGGSRKEVEEFRGRCYYTKN